MILRIAVARPYAQALFFWAQKESSCAQWQGFLEVLSERVRAPGVTALQQRYHPQWVYNVMVDCLGERSSLEKNFLRVLTDHKRLLYAPDILSYFSTLRDQALNKQVVILSTAALLKNDQKARFQKLLSDRLGQEVRVTWKVEPALHSGVLVRIGDWVLDATGLGRLHALETVLRK